MDTMTPPAPARKPTGLRRGQAAKIARIHRCTVTHVTGVARGKWGGRPALVQTIEAYRQRNGTSAAA